MRLKLVTRLAIIPAFFLLLPVIVFAQNFSFDCTRDTAIAGCSPNPCFTLRAIVPDIHGSSATYRINPVSAENVACAPLYSSPAITGTPTNLTDDDTYSGVVNIGFPFPFFGSVYNSLVISSNGVVSFDLSRANQAAHYGMFNVGGVLGSAGGPPENLPSTLYDPAIIMGPYHDIDITIGTSPNRRIQYTTVGAAPNRKWVLSFYQIPLFNCNTFFQNTHQIILNEATGIIEVLVFSKQRCTSWNQGRAIVGIQNFAQDQGLMAPGRSASDPAWGTVNMNESWRFVPSAGASLIKRVELCNLAGTVLATITNPTVRTDGTLEALFPNICPPAGATTAYVVKSVYEKYDNPAIEVAGFDTMRVTRSAATDLNASATSTASVCGAAGSGSITAQVPAGSGSGTYQYSLTSAAGPWQGSATFNNLAAGSYTVYVRDAGGCASAVPVTVSGTGTIPVTFTNTATSCPGAINGTITVNANGTPTTEYRINGGPWQSSNVFNGIPAGTHFIDVRDLPSGCVANGQAATVASGTATITGTATGTSTSCSGVNNGVVTVNSTGAGPFEYSLNAGANWQVSNVFNGLAPGNYNALIRVGGICTSAAIPVTVTAGSGLVPVLTATATSCTGINNGTITVTMPAGTTAPYTIVRDGTTSVSNNTVVVFTGMSAGNHTINVTDAAGCSTATLFTINVPTGTGFTAAFTAAATSCNGATDGSITLTPNAAGTSPYTFLLNPGAVSQNGAAATQFNSLGAATYNALITDANGCQFTLNNMIVTAGPALVATATPAAASCTGVNNGSISITSTGTAPFTFLLDGVTTQTSAVSTTVFNNLTAGTHTITVTDANGCSTATAVSATVTTGTGFTANFAAIPTSCNGATDGSLTITPQAPGTAPYTFLLSPGNISQTGTSNTQFTGLGPATYSVLITDANGCQFTINNMTINQGAGLTATATPTASSCTGVNNGSIAVTTNGTAPFSFLLDGVTTQTSATNNTVFNNLAAGTHSIQITDANGCSTATAISATITTGTGFTATQTVSPVSCAGGSNGTITVTIGTAGTAPYTFVLNGTTTQTGATGTIFNGLPAGTANSIVITDAVGCTFTIANIAITQPAVLAAVSTASAVSCNAGNDGLITITTNGGTAPYQYSLDNNAYQTGNTFSVIAGSYTVYVRDANSCTIQLNNLVVTEPAVLNAVPGTVTDAGCAINNSGSIVVNATGGTAPYQYSSDGTDFQTSSTLSVEPGTYTVTVRDAGGCTFQLPGIVVGLVNDLTITPLTDPAPICEGSTVQLQVISNATGFAWTPVSGINSASAANPVFSPATSTLYTVTATLGRCTGTDDVNVTVLPAPIANAGDDGTICFGQNFQLQGSGGVSYTWTPAANLSATGIANPVVLNPSTTASYTLSVVDANNCPSIVADEVIVNVTPPIKITVSPVDTVVYAGTQFQLTATSVATDYTWSPATALNNPYIANPVVTAPAEGDQLVYQVRGTTAAGCEGEAFVTVRVYKGPDVYIPNAFSPNNDGRNDLFTPFPVGIKKLNYFRIYNRWGKLLFSTSTLHQGWDGKFAGSRQVNGVYVWQIQAVMENDKLINKQGTVTLVR